MRQTAKYSCLGLDLRHEHFIVIVALGIPYKGHAYLQQTIFELLPCIRMSQATQRDGISVLRSNRPY